MTIEQLRELYNTAAARVRAAADAIEALSETATPDEIRAASEEHASALAEADQAKARVAEREAIQRSRDTHPAPEPIAGERGNGGGAVPKGQLRTEQVYNLSGEHSYLRDMLLLKEGNDPQARERLERSNEERRIEGMVYRDLSTGAGAGADFLPPIYLANLVVLPSVAKRKLAAKLPTLPLPIEGLTITIPALSSGGSVLERQDGAPVSEVDASTSSVQHNVRELAGQMDIGRIVVLRSNPAIDAIIVRDLVRRYDARLDWNLINGNGLGQQHIGLRNVTSPNTVAYTDASPTSQELVPKLYDAIQKVGSNSDESPDLMVAHTRRSAWIASNLSTAFPLFQLGGYFQAAGSQDKGFINNVAGLEMVDDRNVRTDLGAGTEDEIYVLAREDFILMEGPLQTRVFEDVGSGTGTIRYQVFAHSAFLSNRYPKSLSIVSGTGLIAPTF